MRKTYEKYEEFKESPYFKVLEDYIKDSEYHGVEDLEECICTVRDCSYESEEDVDSDYIHNTYSLTIENIKFEVVGSSYRKDHSVCDEKMQDSITVIDLVLEKEEKKNKKAKAKAESEAKWKVFFDNHNWEEIYDVVKTLPYPKNLK